MRLTRAEWMVFLAICCLWFYDARLRSHDAHETWLRLETLTAQMRDGGTCPWGEYDGEREIKWRASQRTR